MTPFVVMGFVCLLSALVCALCGHPWTAAADLAGAIIIVASGTYWRKAS